MKRLALPLLCLLSLIPTISHSSTPPRPSDSMESRWVDSVYASLSPRQRVAQLFIPHVITRDNAAGRATLRRFVEQDGVGGILLGKADVADYATLNDYCQSLARVPLMITADAEWGLAMRLPDAPKFPVNLALGAGDDLEAMRLYGREMARECRALGITVSFAPVVDVNSNPRNPVIGYRSFGEDPARVAALGRAYSQGMREGGVLAVPKHFPGHGDTSTDSHVAVPIVDHDRQRLDSVELFPFRAMIDDGAEAIMVGHVTVPRIDNSGRPASLSKRVITDLLKDELGFDGLVFTDALEMAGAQVRGQNNCVLALEAGADVLLGSGRPSADIDAVMSAMESGRLDTARVAQSIKRVLAAKYRLGLRERQHIDAAQARRALDAPEAQGVNERLAAMTVTLLRDRDSLIPLLPGRPFKVVNVGGSGDVFAAECRLLDQNRYDGRMEPDRPEVTIAAVYSDNADAAGRLRQLKSSNKPLIAVLFMTPYKAANLASALEGVSTVIIMGDKTDPCRRAAARAIFGAADIDGHLPVRAGSLGNVGEGISRRRVTLGHMSPEGAGARPGLTDSIDAIVDRGLRDKAYPGIQVMIVKDGNIIYERADGFTDVSRSTPVTSSTLFDLASVSKVSGTLAGLMAAYDDGLFNLDDPLKDHITSLDSSPLGDLSLRSLMLHRSGLPAGLNWRRVALDGDRNLRPDLFSSSQTESFPDEFASGLYASSAARDSVWAYIHQMTPNASKAYKYSDLNFCLLMEAEQAMTGAPHEEWFAEFVSDPLGNSRTLYRPTSLYDASQFAATENDASVRRQTLRGYVHDETAAFSGGVQGNAGLFSNAEGLARWAQMLLDGGQYGGLRLLDPATVNLFLNTRSSDGRRGLGFDVSGPFVGHTGFTGTCIWMDPARKITVIVLTNRVNPTRDNAAFRANDPRRPILNAVDAAFR